MEKENRKISGFKIRLLIASLLFLLIFTLTQLKETKSFLDNCGLIERIESFEDIYRLEDACIVWYNSLADENK